MRWVLPGAVGRGARSSRTLACDVQSTVSQVEVRWRNICTALCKGRCWKLLCGAEGANGGIVATFSVRAQGPSNSTDLDMP
ncbi:hypothetical protein SNOG_06310 [Parastagonospora nodorum SN15]|uniref:Uncharacterized protein n=1 Tax=Phaeosphaeria nodorum (strain SN15 / ATCC MYA-4574 / FGSC 10173) TaxID=321614 RepID=Q0UPK4_PHANO|nr:hypothetical protein SNOG_06310 [Parastagonospora nodorum SN15]EAT86141.1 hypothetical protein SNOG_06310 [Parastagonospora nodorum SN15]